MSEPTFISPASAPFPSSAWLKKHGKAYLTPYYLTIGAVLGAATTGFVALIVVVILIATNFNILALIE